MATAAIVFKAAKRREFNALSVTTLTKSKHIATCMLLKPKKCACRRESMLRGEGMRFQSQAIIFAGIYAGTYQFQILNIVELHSFQAVIQVHLSHQRIRAVTYANGLRLFSFYISRIQSPPSLV